MARGGWSNSGGKSPRKAAPARLKQTRRPPRRRRGFIARAGQRGVTLMVLGAAVLAIVGVAIAGALTTNGNTSATEPAAASTPSRPASNVSPSPAATGPLGPTVQATHTSSPKPQPRPTHSAELTPSASPAAAAPSPSITPKASSSPCPSSAGRVAAARNLLQHQDALPANVTLQVEGARQGLLGASDAQARTLTLYVRSCSDEPTLQLAIVWGYEAGQFIHTEAWDSATRSRWNQLRASSFTSSAQFKQDAASVYAFWQTGSTQYWQSPVAPPSLSRLSQLVPYLKTS